MAGESLVAFIQIPETSSSRFRAVLQLAYTKDGIRKIGDSLRAPEVTATRLQRIAAGASGFRAVTGVVPYGLLQTALPADTRYVTLFRDPVDRVVEEYDRIVRQRYEGDDYFPTKQGPQLLPPPSAETAIDEMLDRGTYLLDNLYTRLLCGSESLFDELPDDALERAQANLERFACVGIVERYDDSVRLLADTLGVDPPTSSEEKTRPVRGTDEQRDAARARNALDVRLYELACERFESETGSAFAPRPAAAAVEGAERAHGAARKSASRSRAWKLLQPERPRVGSLTVFLHIPKTAGSTFLQVLQNNFAVGSVQSVGNVFKGGGGIDRVPLERLRESAPELTYYAYVLAGHLPFGIRDLLERETRYVTYLRDPVERCLSHYYFLRDADWEEEPGALPRLAPGTSLPELLADGRYILDNLQTRMLCGDAEPFGEVTADMLDRAKENLANGSISFGVGERFDESLVLLGERLGLRSLLYESVRVNAVRPRGDSVPDEYVELLRERERYDVELHAWANTLLDAALESRDVDFDVTVAALAQAAADERISAPASFDLLDREELWDALVATRADVLENELELARMRVELHTPAEASDTEAELRSANARVAQLTRRVEELSTKLEAVRARLRGVA